MSKIANLSGKTGSFNDYSFTDNSEFSIGANTSTTNSHEAEFYVVYSGITSNTVTINQELKTADAIVLNVNPLEIEVPGGPTGLCSTIINVTATTNGVQTDEWTATVQTASVGYISIAEKTLNTLTFNVLQENDTESDRTFKIIIRYKTAPQKIVNIVQKPSVYSLVVNPTTVEFDGDKSTGTVYVNVTSKCNDVKNGDWEFETLEEYDWFSVRKIYTSTLSRLNVTLLKENTSKTESRSGVINVSYHGMSSAVTVTQDANPTIEGELLLVTYKGSTAPITVFSSDKFSDPSQVNYKVYSKTGDIYTPLNYETDFLPTSISSTRQSMAYTPKSSADFTLAFAYDTPNQQRLAFSGIQEVKTVEIVKNAIGGEPIMLLMDGMFASCSELTLVDLSNGSMNLIPYQFCNRSAKLGTVILPDSITSIGGYAFANNNTLSTLGEKGKGVYDIGIPSNCTQLGDYAFAYDKLTSIILQGSLTTIKTYCFYSNTELTSITMSNDITLIDDYAFANCTKLPSIVFSSGLTYLSKYICYQDRSLTSITIQNDNTTEIKCAAFAYCDLRSYDSSIPTWIEKIDAFAFYYNGHLDKINISSKLTSIGFDVAGIINNSHGSKTHEGPTPHHKGSTYCYNPFGGCSGVTSITVSSTNPIYTYDTTCNAVYPKIKIHDCETTYLIIGYKDTTIKTGTTVIENCALEDMCNGSSLPIITIPNTVTRIGFKAFAYNDNFLNKTLTIPNSVNIIDSWAFRSTRMQTLSFENSSSVSEIWNCAFQDSRIKDTILFPTNVIQYMGDAAFESNEFISFTLPQSVTQIGENIVQACDNLTDLQVNPLNPNYTSKYDGSERNAIMSKDYNELFSAPNTADLGTGNSTKTEVPIKIIHQYSYAGYNHISSITCPSTVETIENEPFRYSTSSLTSITIQSNVTSAKNTIFDNNEYLKDIYCYCTTYPFSENQSIVPIGEKVGSKVAESERKFHVKSTMLSTFNSKMGSNLSNRKWTLVADL